MIYLIGGTPRVGKSTLASIILQRDSISSLSTDVIRSFLEYSPTKIDIRGLELSKQPEVFFPYFLQLLRTLQSKYPNYVIEGDLFSSEQVASIQKEIDLKCCFLGTSNITLEDLKKIDPKLDWVSKRSPEEQSKLPAHFIKRSGVTKEEAEKYGFPYFDIYPDRESALESAYIALMR
jgi:hypothetical protein